MTNQERTWACPACGTMVRLPEGSTRTDVLPDAARLDGLAHALCGCYVLTMPARTVARLLWAVVGTAAGPPGHNA